jgi:hypothetical protein
MFLIETVAFLLTDIEGLIRLWEEDSKEMKTALMGMLDEETYPEQWIHSGNLSLDDAI